MKKNLLGFTLIELLIVIALLGALAVALLAALDPLEQIKKGNDTGVRNTVAEIHGAFVRFSALQGGVMPFPTSEDGGTYTFREIGTDTSIDGPASVLNTVIQSGELKGDFIQLAGAQLNKVFITGMNDSGNQLVTVCYAPTSKSFRKDVNNKFQSVVGAGTVKEATSVCPNPAGDGTAADGSGTCYWCVR